MSSVSYTHLDVYKRQVLVPYNYHLSDDEIKTQIQKKITEKQSECRAVIKIDKSYTG